MPATFKESPFLMIIDADKNEIFHIYGKQDPDNLVFAKKVVEHDCEAVICGPIEKEPFEILAGAGVTRYLGERTHGAEGVQLYEPLYSWN